ncbi:substrate-binding domain-containing protein [Amycolatopsis acidiphila]|uniref:Substrate-binding domain-containing protein n=2 Tax=Amycolatopsis acidiphila TaxID=715473 RepID=A0A558A529_9PSEU|nr:substrate-binding domain-containing protein [Amycolatopsis acidiphila]
MDSRGVAEEGRAPRLVQRGPQGYPVAGPFGRRRGELREPVRGVTAGPAVLLLQRLRQVEVIQRRPRPDPVRQQLVDEAVVEVQPPRVRRAAMARLLTREPDLDAVFVANDLMAAGALRALQDAGRSVPGDVAVIGFDDHPALAAAMNPPLTTVHQDPAAQVQHMVTILMALLAGEAVRPRRHVLPVSLRLRGSA